MPELAKRSASFSSNDDAVSRGSKRQKAAVEALSSLCAICKTLDLDILFKGAQRYYERMKNASETLNSRPTSGRNGIHYYNDAILVHRFETRLLNPSSCQLCQFFRHLRVQPHLHSRHKLLAFLSSESWLFRADVLKENLSRTPDENYIDTVFMAVVPDIDSLPPFAHEVSWLDYEIPAVGAIFRQPPEKSKTSDADSWRLLAARELNEKYSVSLVQSWFKTCQELHSNACKQRASQEPIRRGFRLIDCTKTPPTIEQQPWGTTYAALSYVWGTTPADLVNWPETVVDAVQVTRDLGLQYLWVDRLCINQSDASEKSYLISRMTTIYEAAEFTIVAAAGSGASHGLPGVRSTPREPQAKYHIDGGSTLLSIMRDPRCDILESQYWTRGWTYQEGVLSNRDLVFTDEQVYWECRCMATHESVDVHLFHMAQTEDTNPELAMADFMLTGIFKGGAYSGGSSAHQDGLVIARNDNYRVDYGFPFNPELSVGARLRGLNEHIREFSKRRLTKDTDSLFAFEGIVGMYVQMTSLFLYNGLPVWKGRIAGSGTGSLVTFALSVSSWHHDANAERSMYVSEACSRRRHLPSWTWAGWNGTVSWRAPPNLEHCAYMTNLVQATIPSLVWSASIYLSVSGGSGSVRLLDAESVANLTNGTLTSMKIRDPYILNQWTRVEDTEREWTWGQAIGRPGREAITSQSEGWSERWYRIGRRLSFISMSIRMTPQEWTAKHASGELISVLMFAGRYTDIEHGTARFLTLQKVQASPERWERVGTLYLVLPFLGNLRYSAGLFPKIPASMQRNRTIVIQ